MNFLVGNTVAGHSHHHASQATIGRAGGSHSGEDFFHQSRKTGFVHLEKLGLFPRGKTGFNREQMGINARKAACTSIFAAFLTFPEIFGPKSFVCGSLFVPPFCNNLGLVRPFFTVGIPFFYVFKCGTKSKQRLLRGRWKTLWRRQKVGACSQKQPPRLDCMLTATPRK